MDITARKLQALRMKMESEAGIRGRNIQTNVVCLLHDVAKTLGYPDRVADQITGDRLVNQPIFSRKRTASRTPRASRTRRV